MKAVFRVECNVPAGFVEIELDDLPFMPVKGMLIAPSRDADPLVVDEVFWFADKPNALEIWLLESNIPQLSTWAYFKKQGYKKGAVA